MEPVRHLPGAPCWAELVTDDLAASVDFYCGMFGWEAGPAAPDRYGYATFTLGGVPIAGALGLPDASPLAVWHVYFTSADLEATAQQVEAAGGSVVSPPRQVMDLGRTAYFKAPDGTGFGAWQPGSRAGYGRADEPGAPDWFELGSLDSERAAAFYGRVFGWSATAQPLAGPGRLRLTAPGAESAFGGIHVRDPLSPPLTGRQWTPRFVVSDAEIAAKEAVALGGSVPASGGRYALIRDPQGAVLSICDAGH